MELFGKRNQAMFDEWSFVHFASGIIMANTGVSAVSTLVAHTIFEVIENTDWAIDMLSKMGWDRYGGDSVANIAGDTMATMAGWALGEARR